MTAFDQNNPEKTNQQVILHYVEALNQGDWNRLQGLFTPDVLIQTVSGWNPLEQVLPMWRELHESFALQLTVEEIHAEADRVALRYTERGTFVRPFQGQEPTGESFELGVMEVFTLQNGKIYRIGTP